MSRRLPTRHAFHSRAMAPAAAELERLVSELELRAPGIPFVSNVTGTWITDDEARSPAYWARHLCQTVRFADGVAALRREPDWVLLEVGPGQALGAWALQHPAGGAPGGSVVLSSLRHEHNRVPDLQFLLETLGGLWSAGVEVDWTAFSRGERRHRVPLPVYPFERTRYWVDPPAPPAPGPVAERNEAEAGKPGAPSSHEKGPDVMDHRAAAQEPEAGPSPRGVALLGVLTGITTELTGIAAEHVDTDADLFRAGFDSLLLLQAIQAIEKRVGVRVSLVELLEEITTLGALAEHLDRILPPDAVPGNGRHATAPVLAPAPAVAVAAIPAPPAFYPPRPSDVGGDAPAPAPAPPAVPLSAPAGGGVEGTLERVVAQQLQAAAQLMMQLSAQQLAALAGHAPPAAAPAHAPAVSASPAASVTDAPAPAHAAGAPRAPRRVEPSPRAAIQPATFVPYQPVNPEGRGAMTDGQRAYLDDFIARYVERTRGSKAHQARYHRALADTRVTARFRRAWKEILYPVVSRRAAGSRVWDVDGNEYVDTAMAFGCALFGHAPDFVTRAIHAQAEAGYGVGPQSPDAGRAAELVCELGGNDRAVFCNSGTEAVMGAIRAARAFTGRERIAYFAGSYHGWSDAVLGRRRSASEPGQAWPSAPGIPAAPLGDVLLLDWDEPASLELLARHVDELALVMVEPVQSRRLDIQPRAFLHELRRMTSDAGTLLHFDELITGFRVAPGGAQEHFGVRADLVTYGKVVGGGLPMGVVAGTAEAMSVFDGGLWSYGDDSYPTGQRTVFAGAYFKHPISMAVACAVLEEVRRRGPSMYEALNARSTRLVDRMNAFFTAGAYPVAAVHFSSTIRFFFGPEVPFADLFNHHLILEGIHVLPETGTHFLSTAHTDDDLEAFYQAVCRSVQAMRRGGFIPEAPGGGPGADPAGSSGPVRREPVSSPVVLPAVGPAPSAEAGRPADSRPSAETASPAAPSASATDVDVDADQDVDAASDGDWDADADGVPDVDADVDVDADGVRVLPLSEGQRQLWIESQMGDEAGCAYIESASIRLGGPLDVEAMRGALGAVVARHDALRATFGADGETQRIHPAMDVDVPLEDFRDVPPAEREDRVEAWVRRVVRRPFDLVAGPLFRFALGAVGDDEHVLLFSFHHAALDGWSAGTVWKDLGELYAAAVDGRAPRLAPLPDHGAVVREQVAAVRADDAAQAYWRAQFADGVPVLELPTDRPRPAARSYRGERIHRVVGGGLIHRLAQAGRPHGLNLFHTFLATVSVWLSRLSGQDDLVVGTPSAGQAAGPERARLVGYGVNVLPIRVRVDAAMPFAAHARRVRSGVLHALEHQEFSFPRLVETLLTTRDPSRPPLFAALMNVDRERGASSLGPLPATFRTNFGGGSKLDLVLEITETPDELRLDCDYGTDLFHRETVEGWLDAYVRLLEQVADAPETPVGRLSLAGPETRRRVVEEWNRTDRPFPRESCIHHLFHAQAARAPDAPALAWGAERLTYAELDARANRLARHLVRLGVGTEDRVGVLLERGLEMVVATLAVLKAGGCCVPVDTSYPPERMGLMLADAGARLLLTRTELAADREDAAPRVLCLDAAADEIAAEGAEAVRSGATAGNLAYVFYTSGSTGRPKGVMMGHRDIVQLAACVTECMPMGPGDRVAQASNASFDAAVFELWCALLNGAALVGVDRDVLLSAPALGRTLRAEGITHLYQTAALFNQHVREQVDVYAELRQLVFGAEVVDTESVRQMLRAGRPGRVLHEYGPTEATVWCTLHPVEEVADDAATVPIGRPIPNARAYVLDPAGEPLPPGVPGELHVGGAGVVRGYLGRPALTAERFVPDPFAAEGGARMYRTGDRVRWRADGRLEFMGRLDQQVKVRGFRIEPGEVEHALASYPGVREARVVVREDAPGDRRLVAYVAGDADGDDLRAHLRRTLPAYMVPQALVRLDRLPLTPNGKLDRAALPAPAETEADAEDGAAPRTPLEEVLAGIWAEVLGRARVGVDAGFFALGGHSLLAMRVVSRIRQLFGVEVPLRALFEGDSVAALAERVEALRRAAAPQLPPVLPVERTEPLPLSFAQERLWFLDRLQPGGAFYNLPVPLRLEGALHRGALHRALGEIVRRHEALRTAFPEVDGAPVQRVAPFAGLALPVEDLSGLDDGAREAHARRRIREEAERPFDLAAGPLFRARLFRLGEEEHVLMLAMHHVAVDGWSMNVLHRELAALYTAYRDGRESPLPEPAVQYADFAAWQRRQLAGEALEGQLAYWRDRLAGAPALLELPTDHPRPAIQTYRGTYERFTLSAELLERLRALGRREGATLYMVLLAAFQSLLARYAESGDVVVGSPVSGRARAETEGLIGFFVNTLVLRTDLSGDPSFAEVLRRVRETTLGAWEHQDVPFERLVEALRPERALSHSPLFQVMFTFDDGGGSGPGLPGLAVREVGTEVESVKFDLGLSVSVCGDGVAGALMYGTDLFRRGTAERVVRHLQRLLEQVAGDAGAALRLSGLDLAGAGERRRVLEEWNATDLRVPASPIHRQFQLQAARAPHAVAVEWGAETMDYAGLDARANRLARRLAGLGVGPEARVGLCLERGAELVAAMLAVLKAGGGYVPLDPTHPPARLGLMLADSGAAVLVTRDALRDAVPVPPGVAVLRVDGQAEEIAAEPADDPGVPVTARSLAYVIYTSGSTGTPKGVAVEHGALANVCAWHARALELSPADRASQLISAGFDGSVLEIWPALAAGARVQVVPDDVRTDPEALRDWMVARGTTVATTPAALTEPLLALAWPAGAALRWMVSGADRLRSRPASSIPFRLTNNYGPTECTAIVSSTPVAPEGEGLPTIGRPGGNCRAYVLDGALRPAPVGLPGELYLGGAQVARGYLGRPALTAERFVPDPFGAVPGARLYRTGDGARWLADGTLDFMGRRDGQVKVRGFRIETGEVEAVLRRHPGVADCAVVLRGDAPGGPRLVAYAAGEGEPDVLRAHLRERLPEYMVPAAVVVLPRLPLTANGKLDRAALPAPEQVADEARFVAPRTPVEAALAWTWAEVLGRDRVGVEESFFDLGGHSLLATRVVSRVRAAFGVDLPVRALFEGPTVAEMAAAVEGLRRADAPADAPVAPAAGDGPVPLTFAQERLWFLDRLRPGGASYNVHIALRLSGALDAAALERALGEVVRRHGALRTTLRETEGTAEQVVHPFTGFTLPVEALSGADPAEREDQALRRASEHAAQPFDLTAGPLFRAALLRLDGDEHALLLNLHHAVSDGWSMRVLFREMWALYAAYGAGRPSPLPEPAPQYADYAVWERARAGGPEERAHLAWWKARLAGAPEVLELPADHPRPPVPSQGGARVPLQVPAAVLDGLRALGRAEGATLYMVVLAAFQVLLARYAGTDDVVVGTPVAGRTRREVEDVVGFFANTLVLRTELAGDPPFREAVRRARETVLGAHEHQALPFERLVAELRPERTLSRPALFQVLFQLDEEPDGAAGGAGLRVRRMAAEGGTANFDLTLALGANPGGLGGSLEYATDLFEPATARRMADHLARLLHGAAAAPDLRLSALELMDPAERARVVEEWNRTEAPYPADRCVHELLAEQAARTPEAVAVVFGEEALTYAELDARANRLARRLAALGAGPEARVAILLERSAGMLAALFGVMKAGAAYLPLDPAYPAERLAGMLEDSGAPLLLTQASLRGLVPAGDARVVVVDEPADAEAIAAEAPEPPRTAVAPGNAAYVIYTSGSTGRPKGVVVTHANAASFFAAMDGCVGGTVPGTWLALARTSFDMSVHELLWTLVRGFRVVVHPDVARSGGAPAVAREIGRHGVTHLVCTPSLASLLVGQCGAECLAGLDRVLLGGEPLPAEMAAEVGAVLPGGVLNMYGPTETTVWSTSHPVAPGEAPVPIGRPVANARVYVLDAALRPQPLGVPGELFIGGPGVARGYLGRPGLTAERFVPDPFAPAPGARLYRTGDRARWLDRGALEFVGRADAQVKVRGFRVEPGEVEAALRRHPAVRECAVVAREDRPGDRRLAAYVVAAEPAPAADDLRAHLRGVLPDYMVPASFTLLPRLPRVPSGKLDRRALPPPGDAAAAGGGDEPRDYLEVRLIQMWEALLRVPVGPAQSFFDLGGDSFLALHLFARVNRAFGCDLPVATLFTGATVRHMAEAVRRQQQSAQAPPESIVALQPEGSLPPLFVIHTLDRGVIGYVNLVRHLGADQPVYGVRDVGEDLSRPVVQIAAEHVAAIRAVQPRGPYSLVGWSFGGTLAYEMAVQLERAGEAVAFLGLMDTLSQVLADDWPWMSHLDNALLLAGEVAERMRRPFTPPAREALEGLDPGEQVRRVARALHAQGAALPGYDADALARQCREVEERYRARAGWEPGPFSGTLTLFRASDQAEHLVGFLAPYTDEERRTLAWCRYAAGPVRVIDVPGAHVTLGAEPHVRVLADRMRRALAEARPAAAEAAR